MATSVQGNSVIQEIKEEDYAPQLEAKKARIETLFSEFHPPALEVFESKPKNYRMRYDASIYLCNIYVYDRVRCGCDVDLSLQYGMRRMICTL
jgi:hypothetical protein